MVIKTLSRSKSREKEFFEEIRNYNLYENVVDGPSTSRTPSPSRSPIPLNLSNIEIICRDGILNTHQAILGQHSFFLKQLFLGRQKMEFQVLDWESGHVQLVDSRCDENISIIMDGITCNEMKVALTLLHSGQTIVRDEKSVDSLNEIWKMLKIESINIKDLSIENTTSTPSKIKFQNTNNSNRSIKRKRSNLNSNIITPKLGRKDDSTSNNSTKLSDNRKNGQFYICDKCGDMVHFSDLKFKAYRLKRFINHILGHFKEQLFGDIPRNVFEESFYCPYNPECAGKKFNTFDSFVCHLSMSHDEFYNRLDIRLKQLTSSIMTTPDYSNELEQEARILNKVKNYLLKGENFPRKIWSINKELYTTQDYLNCFEKYDSSIKIFGCNLCNMKFKNEKIAIRHLIFKHPKKFDKFREMKSDSIGILKCYHCDLTYYNDIDLIFHIGHDHDAFNTNKIWECIQGSTMSKTEIESKDFVDDPLTICDDGITFCCHACHPKSENLSRKNMTIHLKSIHGDEEVVLIQCYQCNTFLDYNDVEQYLKDNHNCVTIPQVNTLPQDSKPKRLVTLKRKEQIASQEAQMLVIELDSD